LTEVTTNEAVAFHSRIAADFHSSYAHDANRRERVVVWRKYLDKYVRPTDATYDLGCGSGMLTAELATRARLVTAIDGASGMLETAEKHTRGLGLANIAYRQHTLPIADTSQLPVADLVISSSVIEYLESLPAALDGIRALLRDDGLLIFSMSNANSISRALVRLIYRLTGKPEYFGFLRHFVTPQSMQGELARAQFDLLEYTYFGGADRLNRLLGTVFPRSRATNMVLFVARKRAGRGVSDNRSTSPA
jgi:SAM-dependent methyltransferase